MYTFIHLGTWYRCRCGGCNLCQNSNSGDNTHRSQRLQKKLDIETYWQRPVRLDPSPQSLLYFHSLNFSTGNSCQCCQQTLYCVSKPMVEKRDFNLSLLATQLSTLDLLHFSVGNWFYVSLFLFINQNYCEAWAVTKLGYKGWVFATRVLLSDKVFLASWDWTKTFDIMLFFYESFMWRWTESRDVFEKLQLRTNHKLRFYKQILLVKARRNIPSTAFSNDRYPGLIHFLYIYRNKNIMKVIY